MKINDGIILATDSSSTIFGKNEKGINEVHHTYFTANKLFNLKKEIPIGVMTWGNGSVNNESISTLIKDYKQSSKKENNSVISVAYDFKKFLGKKIDSNATLGFIFAGYSKEGKQNIVLIEVEKGNIKKPMEIYKEDPLTVLWFGNTNFITRYLLGFDERLKTILKNNNLSMKLLKI